MAPSTAAARTRPRRGTRTATRARLVAAAAEIFNRDGYHGTDSNRIAKAAGYAPGSFYKHFPDKRAIFLEAYEAWVTAEWQAVGAAVAEGGTPREIVARIVTLVLALHRRWRVFRASMRVLVATDPEARRCHRRQRAHQLRMFQELRKRHRLERRTAEEDAFLLFTLERVGDALAEGEVRDLGLSARTMTSLLTAALARHLH